MTDFGAVPFDGIDDSAAFQSAVDVALQRGGGTIVVPSGRFQLNSGIRVIPNGWVGADIMFSGQKGAIIDISMGRGNIAFNGGNLNSFVFEDLVFVGKPVPYGHPDFFDAWHVIFANYVNQLNITRCQFYGLATQNQWGGQTGVVYVGIADAKITDSQFDGNLSLYPTGSIIEAVDYKGLTVSRSTFLDYANLRGEYHSKTPSFVGAWIRARNNTTFDKSQQRRLVVEDTRFDEGAAYAIDVKNVAWVHVHGIFVNVNGTTPGRGIRLMDVEYARVEMSTFGWSRFRRPAIETFNTGGLDVSALRFSEQVFFLVNNGLRELKVEFCPACTTSFTSPLKATNR